MGTQNCTSVGVKTTAHCPTPSKTEWGDQQESSWVLFASSPLPPTPCQSYGLEKTLLFFKGEISGVFLLPALSSTSQTQALLIGGRMSSGVMVGRDLKAGMREEVAGSHHYTL